MSHAAAGRWAAWVAGHRKALAGGAAALGAALGTALADGHIGAGEIPGLFLALLAGGGLVHLVPNTAPEALEPPPPGT